jgi:hypothetical protein
MGLETGSTIASFITSNPTSSDPVNQGDDHLRLIKSVLQAQFPGVGGLGYATAITTTEYELNALHGLTNYYFPSGTRMPFAQAAAPTGWTQDTSDNANNRMLRVVSSAGNGVGGTDSPIVNSTTMVAHTHTFSGSALANHTHTDAGHSHTYYQYPGSGALTGWSTPGGAAQPTFNPSGVTSTGNASISSVSAGTPSGTNSTTTGVSWTPRYIDMIICSKN